ncbi:MAG: hypothetical protein P4L83_21990 [Nevskia sp.]|nr:hypothetical protein [Nevskia sp.]
MLADLKSLAAGFDIEGRHFAWGATVAELRRACAGKPAQQVWETAALRYPCKTAYGFPAVGFYARGPAEERPVLSLIFDLAPYAASYARIRSEWWADAIQGALGEPRRVYRPDPAEVRGVPASGVVYSAGWGCSGAELHLSVYGGFRKEQGGTSVAGLFIHWRDEIAAAQPYLAGCAELERRLALIAAAAPQTEVFGLGSAQTPFRGPPPPEPVPADEGAWRRAQRALRCSNLCETPAPWAGLLRDDQVLLWRSADAACWGLANRWDCSLFDAGAATPRQWSNLLPGRGPGGTRLGVGDFVVTDVHNSEPVQRLAQALEPLLGRAIRCEQDYDS